MAPSASTPDASLVPSRPPGPGRWRQAAILTAAGLAVVILVVLVVLHRGVRVVLAQADLQTQLDERFPLERPIARVLTLTLRDPRLELSRGCATIHFTFAGGVLGSGLIRGSCTASITPRYEPATGELYADHARLDNLHVDRGDRLVQRLREEITLALTGYLANHPIYVLDASNASRSIARAVLSSIVIEPGQLVIELRW